MGQKNSNQSGQSIVIMAFAIVILMGIMAVAIDGGRIYTLRRDAQNAADAAALQGARALCRDEDFEAKALEVADINGFAGAGVVEVNNPPVRSDSPTVNDDQVEVVITATIDGGMIAPVVYQGEINTRVLAVGDCLRGTLSGTGSAIFAGCSNSTTNSVDVNASQVTIIGGVHSNSQVHISGGGAGAGNQITGTVSHVNGASTGNNTTLYPPDGNPATVGQQNYPIDLEYADFIGPNGWAYSATVNYNVDHYHIYNGEINGGVLASQGWLNGSTLEPGVYVTPVGFKFASSGLLAPEEGVTFVTLGKIDITGGNSSFRPYFGGLLMMTEHSGNPCDNNWAIRLAGSNLNWGGIIFAPSGRVSMSGASNVTFYGSIIAGTVDLSGSIITLIYDPSYLPPDPDTIELGQ